MMKIIFGLLLFTITTCCFSSEKLSEQELNDICDIFKSKPTWFAATNDSKEKWGVPIPVTMAIMFQESHFKGNARPHVSHRSNKPWLHGSSAFGYAQAVNSTWRVFKKQTKQPDAKRNNFADSADFIGWFVNNVNQRLGVAKSDAYKVYLAYYDGLGGFMRKFYLHQPWLIRIAHGVQAKTTRYKTQLELCKEKFIKDVTPTVKPKILDLKIPTPFDEIPGKNWLKI